MIVSGNIQTLEAADYNKAQGIFSSYKNQLQSYSINGLLSFCSSVLYVTIILISYFPFSYITISFSLFPSPPLSLSFCLSFYLPLFSLYTPLPPFFCLSFSLSIPLFPFTFSFCLSLSLFILFSVFLPLLPCSYVLLCSLSSYLSFHSFPSLSLYPSLSINLFLLFSLLW